ncbi:MAG: putative Ig domain-containing protein [Deltaproteobacteria bacterium]
MKTGDQGPRRDVAGLFFFSGAESGAAKFVSGRFTEAKLLIISQPVSASFIYPIPESTFSHSNPTAQVALEARMAYGSPLPAWMSFDPVRKVIMGTPPEGATGGFEIRITAKDQFGGEAQTFLKITVGM